MAINPNIGYKSSSARTIIRKYSIGWNNWKHGNTKPNKGIFGYQVTISYRDYLMPLYDRERVEIKVFDNRDSAVLFRNNAIDNLKECGIVINDCIIKLVRL